MSAVNEFSVSDLFLIRNFSESNANLHQIDSKQILCPIVKHIESDTCPWDWAVGCSWSSFIAVARLDFVPNQVLVSF